ncbi:hypothetical protein [Fusobacterium ulcerans]|uniref:hypothetical protein n=1 Tax=Fusobacterium ulcerans TaxID=861 RepID=UPI001D0BBE97|nr:hypothetical protein [Fusobacterium ulcerans]MCB8566297.1 hypothetical protein [Fusobacterium ulcerans]MCB8650400.1 hypothetical protein [Fusobacterium ulcerans]
MRVEKIMLISEELGRISKDFLNGYRGINIELNSKEINGVFTDLYINDKIKKDLLKKYSDIYFYSLHQYDIPEETYISKSKREGNYFGTMIIDKELNFQEYKKLQDYGLFEDLEEML